MPIADSGYIVLRRTWQKGDIINLSLDMPTHCMLAYPSQELPRQSRHPRRGPIVYAFEALDNAAILFQPTPTPNSPPNTNLKCLAASPS